MLNTENTLEINIIKEHLCQYAFTSKAKAKLMELEPYMVESELRSSLHDTTEARELIEKAGNPPLSSMEDIDEYVNIATKGGCLSAEQLEKVSIALTGIKRLKDYLKRCQQFEIGLVFFEENLDSLDKVREKLNISIRSGKVEGHASRLLENLRADIERAESKMREKADSVMRSNKDCMSDNFSTMRGGHVCIPVKKDCKFKIAGSVIDKSSTGNTLFIEPVAAAKYYEELNSLRIDEENEVQRILYELSGLVADSADIMNMNQTTVERLDFIFAKGKLSIEYDGAEPAINTERYIELVNGRHPLMDKKINVPLNIALGKKYNGIIITGPNTGGKTVAIKTVAINAYLAQCGLHVACESANICMNNGVYCDIGDGQNIAENLSTFSSHIVNVLDILKRADNNSLVVMDELGSGTDPAEGMGIAVAVLEELKKSGALYLVTTHYPEIKTYANNTEGVINARMTFDKESLKPLYQLVVGEAGESCAFYIAQRLGMPLDMLRRASFAAYNKDLPKELSNNDNIELTHEKGHRIVKKKSNTNNQTAARQYNRGDSVMVLPDRKIGIVCKTANEKGVLQVQLQNKKIWINHKRIKLNVPAEELYPEDYDFSIVFDSVENRKARHSMDRKFDSTAVIREDD